MRQQARQWWQQGTRLARQGQQQTELFDQLGEQLCQRDMHVLIPAIWGSQQAAPQAIPALLQGVTHAHTKQSDREARVVIETVTG